MPTLWAAALFSTPPPTITRRSKGFTEAFRHEYFAGDAEKLLSNSADHLPRSTILNRNAAAIADLLQVHVGMAGSPVLKVLYPSVSDTVANCAAFMRPATTEFTPGYGYLLSIDFTTLATARAFYDNLHMHHGPHLGAHLTLAFNYNDCVLGKEWEEFKYQVEYGLRTQRREQVRIAVGLEEVGELVPVFEEALKFAVEALKEGETYSRL
ncbi:putative cystathionine gamma-synthase protein [Mycena sanguinolenta]|uniref:Putative cystathionine gamma-synthase protein n=1 Tax=Mycena sanguinolenta TaxID=230812 RepID=A0A8H7D1G2_9AGAR|nr:putative cystathionine gamma-synthase protein [Mycena sanguinolenta]